jgi:protein-tyrosine phosphatase
MMEVVRQGVTHIVDMQIEFDDTRLAEPYGIKVLWNPVDDDFEPKSKQVFQRGVSFAQAALEQDDGHKLFVHCAAGVHRAPMMTLAILGRMGWDVNEAMRAIQSKRPVVDWAEVYVGSVRKYLDGQHAE